MKNLRVKPPDARRAQHSGWRPVCVSAYAARVHAQPRQRAAVTVSFDSGRAIPAPEALTAAPPLAQQPAAAAAAVHSPPLRGLYPPSSPHLTGRLKVTGPHELYYEVHGNPLGAPALFLHGGPGAGCFANHARFFDPQHYRIVLLDQRGCGRSTPAGCLAGNTTAALVEDLEALRRALAVQQWAAVLGGSWGVTLALAYAQAHPAAVGGLVLRGICLMRPAEVAWMFGGGSSSYNPSAAGAAVLRPLAWSRFLEQLPLEERREPLLGYYSRLLSSDERVRADAARAWSTWEMSVGFGGAGADVMVWNGSSWVAQPAPGNSAPSQQRQQQQQGDPVPQGEHDGAPVPALPPAPAPTGPAAAAAAAAAAHGPLPALPRGEGAAAAGAGAGPAVALSGSSGFAGDAAAAEELLLRGLQHAGQRSGGVQALLTAHFSLHSGFLKLAPLLSHMDRVRHIPCIAVQGAADLICPPCTAVELSTAWPEAELRIVPGAGHSMYDPRITHELVCATDRFRAVPRTAGTLIGASAAESAL